MNKKVFVLAISLVVLVILLIGGISLMVNQTGENTNDNLAKKGEQAAVNKGAVVNVYTSRHYTVDRKLFEQFTKATGIKVNEVKGTADELIDRLKREGEHTEADLFITVDGGSLQAAKQNNVLQPIRSSALVKQVDKRWRDVDEHWTAISARARVIVYAKDRVKPEELSTYEDLTSEKWKGRVLVRSSSNLYNQSLLASFIKLNGIEEAGQWASGITMNMARQPEGGDRDQAYAIVDKVGDVALMNSYYIGQMLNANKPEEVKAASGLGVYFPNQQTTGVHMNVSGIGLTKYAKNKDNAIKLIEYMTSQAGQTLLSNESYEFPVNESAEMPPLLKSWGSFKAQSINYAELGDYQKEVAELFQEAGWK
ncbi:Fe(3+) ABC transporter substrate-binding protein [Paenibacillus sp. SC116]|uniref:Fe(3+) ABC transporter substrate-binding protein n=1 Tax=Paenibacillus sp. SC116 TaxID=2968986 RepID=UPI00215B371A|nr:Fe(3+) ABC transporter substrate-binding protein [Paenibacillus sp. SC116]MCR8842187.1 Fe(3+) ABC transporter substrate-binding protein [Paenibacillus sp. SC116]